MGLGRAFLGDLLELKRRGALDQFTKVVEIGAQQLADSLLKADDDLTQLYSLFAVPRIDLGQPVGRDNFARRAPTARVFWMSLGFDHAAIDYGGQGGSLALDLNADQVPDELKGSFDLVINTGTSEHVANQDNCFRVMHDLARPGGVMYHEVPAFLFGHGLVNYSPKFFLQLLRQNDYSPLFFKIRASRGSIPRYVRAMNRKWGPGEALPVDDVTDLSIAVAFKKRRDEEFSTPLDLPRKVMAKHYLRRVRTLKHLLPMR
jgi:SAM-dependent methyltransferase